MADLERVYSERLRINPGAAELVRSCQAVGLKTLLVSGGFTFLRTACASSSASTSCAPTLGGAQQHQLRRAHGRMVDQAWGDICDGLERRTMLEVALRCWA